MSLLILLLGGAAAQGVGSSAGTSTVAAIGASTAEASASANGTGAALGSGTWIVSGVGASSGVGTASGIGAQLSAGVGSSSGTCTATGAAGFTASAVGTSTVSATGAATATSTASGTGTGSASATGTALKDGSGASSGTSTVSAIGRSLAVTSGEATGTAISSGVGSATATASGSSVSTSTAAAIAQRAIAFVRPRVDIELSGIGNGWTNLTPDVIGGLRITYGINGSGPSDRVASSGSCSFTLNNSTANSAGILGYYSPASLSTRDGFGLGSRVRVQFLDPATNVTHTRFIGAITAINPVAGRYGARTVAVVAADWFDAAARATVSGLDTQLNVRSDEVINLLIGNVATAPEATDIDTGDVTFAYALDTARDDRRNPVLQELARVTLSEYGWLYQRGDGTVVFERQTARFNRTADATLDNTMSGLSVSSSRSDLVTRVQVITHPRTVDLTTQVLYRLQTPTKIGIGETITIVGGYTDPGNRASRVGGKNMVEPVAGTDYIANTAADGSGTVVTGSLTVSAELGSNSVRWEITNNGSAVAYLTTLHARGIGIYDYEQTIAEANDSGVAAVIGEQVASLDFPYQSDPSAGVSLAGSILRLYGAESAQTNAWALGTSGASELGQTTRLPSAIFAVAGSVDVAPKDDDLQTQILVRDVGDLVALAEDVTGLDRTFAIQSVALEYHAPGHVWASWGLSPVDSTTYFEIGIAGYEELGVTSTLA